MGERPSDAHEWSVYRGYGVRHVDGARLWCYTSDQEQSPRLAHLVVGMLNAQIPPEHPTPVDGPSREQVAEAITAVLLDRSIESWAVGRKAKKAADAVLALLAVPDEHRVLWETKTLELSTRSRTQSMITHRVFDLPPGTRVRVVADVD